jgi:hypothetical protein
VTLALNPQNAERLISAASSSQITFALAHENDPSAVIDGDQIDGRSNLAGN